MSIQRTDALAQKKASAELLRDLEERRMTGVTLRHQEATEQYRRLDQEIKNLKDRLTEEATVIASNPHLGRYYAEYFGPMRAALEACEARKCEVMERLNSIEVEFVRAIRQKKTFELVAERSQVEIRKRRDRAETSAQMESMMQAGQSRGFHQS